MAAPARRVLKPRPMPTGVMRIRMARRASRMAHRATLNKEGILEVVVVGARVRKRETAKPDRGMEHLNPSRRMPRILSTRKRLRIWCSTS